jgi:hypothetical protein
LLGKNANETAQDAFVVVGKRCDVQRFITLGATDKVCRTSVLLIQREIPAVLAAGSKHIHKLKGARRSIGRGNTHAGETIARIVRMKPKDTATRLGIKQHAWSLHHARGP